MNHSLLHLWYFLSIPLPTSIPVFHQCIVGIALRKRGILRYGSSNTPPDIFHIPVVQRRKSHSTSSQPGHPCLYPCSPLQRVLPFSCLLLLLPSQILARDFHKNHACSFTSHSVSSSFHSCHFLTAILLGSPWYWDAIRQTYFDLYPASWRTAPNIPGIS